MPEEVPKPSFRPRGGEEVSCRVSDSILEGGWSGGAAGGLGRGGVEVPSSQVCVHVSHGTVDVRVLCDDDAGIVLSSEVAACPDHL